MDELHVRVPGIAAAQTLYGRFPTMNRAIVDNQEHAPSVIVRRPRHHLLDQTIKRRDAIAGLATTEDSSVMDIESCEVNPSAAPFVSILNAAWSTGLTGLGRMKTASGLNAGLFIGRDNEFVTL
jgi:hypothetical protein